MILRDQSLLNFWELPYAFFKPIIVVPTTALKNVFKLAKNFLTDEASMAFLFGDLLLRFDLYSISELGRNFPICGHDRLAISLKVTDLKEVKASIFILQKVADKVVQTTFLPRVDVSL